MKQEEYFIDISELKDEFRDHLDLEQNERIVFSARFGNGKTTFLKIFFENNNDYKTIHIYPIHYSVASNEDIFELIKYDILFKLITTELDLDESVDSFIKIAKKSPYNNVEEVLKLFTPFLSIIPLIGNAVQKSTERLTDFFKKTLDQSKDRKKSTLDSIEEYLKEFTTIKGNIYEEDFYTRLIASLVERLKYVGPEKENQMKTVLIIDDLDRIDPEHIFRILNIFAAHQDTNSQGNKFGFDKIIVVCDIDNIRNIFHHKYGASTDFNGYIDKFYSVEVFKYSMMEELYKEVDSILNSIKGNEALEKIFNLRRDPNYIFKTIQNLLRSFVKSGIINVRNVVKLKENKYNLYVYTLNTRENYNNIQFWGVVVFNFLKTIFGDYQEVMTAFEKSRNMLILNNISMDKEFILQYLLLPIYCIEIKETTVNIPTINKEKDIHLSIRLERNMSKPIVTYFAQIKDHNNSNWESVIPICHLNELFYRTFKVAYDKNYLK